MIAMHHCLLSCYLIYSYKRLFVKGLRLISSEIYRARAKAQAMQWSRA